ncbi:MAG: DUF58 domain-containing protein [Ruminococcus sp.]|jgi:uncharacterized protein (DUF58 family)|nr:DUF58 domain-containing protein [Ruminococcus sp.]
MKTVVNILETIIIIVIAVLFALAMDSETGWTFAALVVFGLLFSAFVVRGLIIPLKAVSARADINAEMLYKGETVTLSVTAFNKTIVPVPDLRCEFITPKTLEMSGDSKSRADLTLSSKTEVVVTETYRAVSWGKSTVGVKEFILRDFLNVMSFSPKYLNKPQTFTVKVFPDIPEIASDSPIVKNTVNDLKFDNETEETEESNSPFTQGGYPGYTHREYNPGDPLKRINWKLSAKRDELYVRADDEVESMRQTITLDPLCGEQREFDEKAVESVLGLAMALVKDGFKTSVWFLKDGEFVQFECAEPFDLIELQRLFAEYEFVDTPKTVRIPSEAITAAKQAGAVLFVSPADDIAETAERAEADGLRITTVSCGTGQGDWNVTDGYEFRK